MKIKCIGLLLFLLLTSCRSSGNTDDATIKIAYLPITHSVALMTMEEMVKDKNEPYQIEMVRFTSWPEVVDALRTSRVDGASVLFEVALRAQETDGNLAMLSLSHRDGNVVVVDNSISSYQDLIGKTIAIPHRLSPQNTLLNIVLERENIAIDQIHIIEISPVEMPFTMASGTISAYIVAEPYGSVAESAGVGYILEASNDIYPDAACCVLVFNKNVLESDDTIMGWLDRSFMDACVQTHKKDEKVIQVFKRRSSFSEAVIAASLTYTSYDRLEMTQEEYERRTETILRYGVLSSVPLYEDFVVIKP